MNKTSKYELTIIVPVYNEEDNITALEERLSVFLPDAKRTSCVLFVDDGSGDSSLQRIMDICRRHTAFFFLSLELHFLWSHIYPYPGIQNRPS